jgi:SHS2 domain-containing protein
MNSRHGGKTVFARWEHFPHDADIGVRGYGATLAEAFAQAALALSAAVTDLNNIDPRERIELACSAPDAELLLAEWLNVLIFEMSTRQMLFSRFDVTIDGNDLRATVYGEPVSRAKHEPAVEPKGATYTALSVQRDNEHWIAQCIIDV